RVLLGRILATPTNFLLLDEPTNHLDMESIEALVESLENYEGAVMIVTHSEHILRSLATRLIIFDGDAPRVFEHDYDYFLEKVGWGSDDSDAPSAIEPNDVKSAQKARSKDELRALKKEINRIDKEMSKLETELKEVELRLVEASETGQGERIQALSKEHTALQQAIEQKYLEFEAATKLLDESVG
ncbi:MAG: ABC-F family ATP-binding cassette domain-containing protein, partial [Bdellovibrionales bacterium]|nr:ABC-F family ATP-binding cassette domain-containing protein [Bdellovibrionales bacterium]